MANIKTITVEPNTEFQNLATVAGVTFTNGTSYQLQIRGDVYLCESASKPDDRADEGYRIVNDTWTFDCKGVNLWFRNYGQYEEAVINIGD